MTMPGEAVNPYSATINGSDPKTQAFYLATSAFDSFGLDRSANADTFNAMLEAATAAIQSGKSAYDLYPFMLEQSRQIAHPGVAAQGPNFNSGGTPSGGGGAPSGGGPTPDGGYSYADLSQYLGNYQDRGLVQVGGNGSDYILLKNDSGKTVAAYQLDPETGKYYAVDGVGAAGGTGGGAGGGSGGGSAGASNAAQGLSAQQQYDRQVLENDRAFGENVRQYNQNFGENQRQFDATNQRMNLSDVGQLGVQLGNLSLEQQKYVGEILRNPSDFLARAFSQRGGKSPFPEITQADLINNLKTEFDRIKQFTGKEMQSRLPLQGAQPGLPLPGAPGQPRLNLAPTTGPGSQTNPAQFTGTNSIAGGTDAQQNYNPAYGMPENPANYAAIAQNADNLYTPQAGQQDYRFEVDANGSLQAIPRKKGTSGLVNDRLMLTGEGGPGAKPELVANPTGAPIGVVKNSDTMKMLEGGDTETPRIDMSSIREITTTDHADGKRTTRLKIDGYRGGTTKNDVSATGGGSSPMDPVNALKQILEMLTNRGIPYGDLAADYPTPINDGLQPSDYPSPTNDVPDGQGVFKSDAQLDPSQLVDMRGGNGGGFDRSLIRARGAKENFLRMIPGYEGGTLDALSPDVMGRMSLFDNVGPQATTQQELLQNAQMSTPTGVAQVANGQMPNPLNVTTGSSFKLFSPQQYMSLTPDEQQALSTRLASENKSLGDFLYASNKSFAGRPRSQRRARFDVTA